MDIANILNMTDVSKDPKYYFNKGNTLQIFLWH